MDATTTAVKSADRALLVLEYLASVPTPRGLADIADALTIPRSSLHGLLRTMQNRGWLSTDDLDGGLHYRIGPQALTVGASYLQSDDIFRRTTPLLDAISLELGETIHLGELQNGEVMYLEKRDARHSLRLVSGVGMRLPAYATALGKMLLSELDDAALSARLAAPRPVLTPKTLVDEKMLRDDLAATAARGYAIDDEESTEGVRCFSFPIGAERPHRYAISCSVPVARLDRVREAHIIEVMGKAAADFSEPSGIGVLQR
jgi:DNA-binding IclR family transcriptional regulator